MDLWIFIYLFLNYLDMNWFWRKKELRKFQESNNVGMNGYRLLVCLQNKL